MCDEYNVLIEKPLPDFISLGRRATLMGAGKRWKNIATDAELRYYEPMAYHVRVALRGTRSTRHPKASRRGTQAR